MAELEKGKPVSLEELMVSTLAMTDAPINQGTAASTAPGTAVKLRVSRDGREQEI